MFVPRVSQRLNAALREGVARGLLPFDWCAARLRADLRPHLRGAVVPASFTDKVRYKLARDRRPITRVYADKLAVRDYVRSLNHDVRLPRLFAVVQDERAAVAAMPREPWVMKASHGSGMVLLAPTPGSMSPIEVARRARDWLQTDYALRYWEWQYFRLPRRVLFEEYLGEGARTPDDYKLYVVHQRVRFIEVDQNRFCGHMRDFYRPDWRRIESRIGPAPTPPAPLARPPLLDAMIRIAESLSRDTDFLRVDLYAVRGEVYFGELTHSPAAGNFGFEDPLLDADLGRDWAVPSEYV